MDCDDSFNYITGIEIEIVGYTDEYCDREVMGIISGRIVDINEMIINDEFISGYLDCEQPDLYDIYLTLENKSGIGHKNNIFSIVLTLFA